MSGNGRMQLRSKKVVNVAPTRPRVRSQTVTKSIKKESTDQSQQDEPQIVPATPEPISTSSPVPTAPNVTRKALAVNKQATKLKKTQIPVSAIGLTPPKVLASQVHHDQGNKASKLPRGRLSAINDASSRVLKECKQFSPVQSPQHTPKKLSILYATFDKENTPPTKATIFHTMFDKENTPPPKTVVDRTAVTLAPPVALSPKLSKKKVVKKQKSQLPRRSTSNYTGQVQKTSSSSLSSSDRDCPRNSARDNASESKHVAAPLPVVERIAQKAMAEWKPLSQSTPKDLVLHETNQVDFVADTVEVDESRTIALSNDANLESHCEIISETPGFSSGEKVFMKFHNHRLLNSAKKRSSSIPTSCIGKPKHKDTSHHEHEKPVSFKPVEVCSPTTDNRSGHVSQIPRSVPSSKLSFEKTPSVSSSCAIPVQYTTVSSASRIQRQLLYCPTRQPTNAAACCVRLPWNQLNCVSVHTAALCSTSVAQSFCRSSHAVSAPKCASSFSSGTHHEPLSVFNNPSLGHLVVRNAQTSQTSGEKRGNSIQDPQSQRHLLLTTVNAIQLDDAADLEVERLTHELCDTTSDSMRAVVNPVASNLAGSLHKYSFRPIQVPSRQVVPQLGSAFRRIMIC